MKIFTGKGIFKKIIIAFLTFVLVFQFMLPIKSEAIELPTVDEVFTGMAQILAGGGDLVMGALNNFMLGTKGVGTAMITNEALGNGSWFDPEDDDGNAVTADVPSDLEEMDVGTDKSENNIVVYVEDGTIVEGAALAGSDTWEVPNLIYCPENIFGNNIAMLDVNFLNPNEYSEVVTSGRGVDTAKEKNGADSSIAGQLKDTIVKWYKAFRLIAVVALLSILVYLGIRILISSTAEDKAKYKEVIKDWLIALVLVFAMHIIMLFAIMIVNQINALFVNVNKGIYVNYGGTMFRSNFTGVIRFMAQSQDVGSAWAYTIIYIVLVAYTVTFTFQYLKRVLYISFYTMIAPLVAITYPLDKLGDGQSQAFNKWLKEYVMTMALQPIHLIIYTMIVSSALTLSIKSPLYAIVAIGFLIPAEQFIKSLFGVESKADGGFAAGAATTALAMNALGRLRNPVKPPKLAGGKDGKDGDNDSDENNSKIRQSSNKELESFNRNSNTEMLGDRENTEDESEESNDNSERIRQRLNVGEQDEEETEGAIRQQENNGPQQIEADDYENMSEEDSDAIDYAEIPDYDEEEDNDPAEELDSNSTGNNESVAEENVQNPLQQGKEDNDAWLNRSLFRDSEPTDEERKNAQKESKRKLAQAKKDEFIDKHPKIISGAKTLKSGAEKVGKGAKNAANKIANSKAGKWTRNLATSAANLAKDGIDWAGDKIDDFKEKREADAPKRAIRKAVNKKYRGKIWTAAGLPGQPTLASFARGAGKVAKGTAKAAGKVAQAGLRGAGGVIGAGAGLAIGIATGKGVQGAMQGLGIGAAAGIGLGSSVYNVGEGVVKSAYGIGEKAVKTEVKQRKSVRDMKREREIERIEATEGVEAADKYARDHISKADRKRYDQILNDYTIQTGQNLEDVKDKSELYKDIYDYESHNVSDTKKIIKGLQLENHDKYRELRETTGLDKNQDKHDNIVDIMKMTNSYGKEYTTEGKKQEQFEKALEYTVKTEKDRDKVRELFYEANGVNYKFADEYKAAKVAKESQAKTTKKVSGKTSTQTVEKVTQTDTAQTVERPIKTSKVTRTNTQKLNSSSHAGDTVIVGNEKNVPIQEGKANTKATTAPQTSQRTKRATRTAKKDTLTQPNNVAPSTNSKPTTPDSTQN